MSNIAYASVTPEASGLSMVRKRALTTPGSNDQWIEGTKRTNHWKLQIIGLA